jgi:carboxymethylenebutenolidase
MQIQKKEVGLTVDDSLMRVYTAFPEADGQYPGIVFYSDIYQLGRPITLLADRLAGYGYFVAAPEIFHRIEPIGTVIEPNALGRLRGNDNARRTEVSEYDADARAILDLLLEEPTVISEKIGTLGFCIGGHLAFRTAFNPEVKATVCCYPTGVHSGKLGRGVADTIDRVNQIKGKLLTVFGTLDPHVPPEGREKILKVLEDTDVLHTCLTYEANHTFMRDDGYRFDPVATDEAWREIIGFLANAF